MATNTIAQSIDGARSTPRTQVVSGLGFDWAVALFSLLLTGGLYLDGWAHNHGKVDQTFFTPWHAILYSSMALTGAFLALALARNRIRGASWREALPRGYWLSLVGIGLFVGGGLGDLVWHTLFGIEASISALLSPTHLLLATAGFLIVTGPLRAVWRRKSDDDNWATLGPALISVVAVLSIITFFLQFANPFDNVAPAIVSTTYVTPGLGVASIVLHSAIVMGLVLLLARRWTLPPGAITFIFTLNAIPVAALDDRYALIPAMVTAGIIADILLARLKPSAARPRSFYAFAFLAPAVLYALYFAALAMSRGIFWTIHLWLGSIFMAGITGLFVSFLLLFPLELPDRQLGDNPRGKVG